MAVLSKEKFKVLAEQNGWTNAFAEGYVDGEAWKKHGKSPSRYTMVGIDEYSLGFRAGYFQRAQGATTIQRDGVATVNSLAA